MTLLYRKAQLDANRAEQISQFLEDMATSANPDSGGKARTVLEMLDESVRRLEERDFQEMEVEAGLRLTISRAYLGMGKYSAAEEQMREALDLLKQTYANDHPQVNALLCELGMIMRGKGTLEESEILLRQAHLLLHHSQDYPL